MFEVGVSGWPTVELGSGSATTSLEEATAVGCSSARAARSARGATVVFVVLLLLIFEPEELVAELELVKGAELVSVHSSGSMTVSTHSVETGEVDGGSLGLSEVVVEVGVVVVVRL